MSDRILNPEEISKLRRAEFPETPPLGLLADYDLQIDSCLSVLSGPDHCFLSKGLLYIYICYSPEKCENCIRVTNAAGVEG